jgi:putative membrane protein
MNTGTRTRKRAFAIALAATVTGLALPSWAQVNSGTTSPGYGGNYNQNQQIQSMSQHPNSSWASPSRFIQQAQVSSEFERQAAELGTQRAQNPQLKQFAQQIIQNQSQNQQQLQSLAQSQNLTQSQPLPKHLAQRIAKLDEQSGQSFDQALAKCLLKENAFSLKRSQQAAQSIQDPQVKQFARNLEQQQQQRLQQAVQVARAVGVSQDTIASFMSEASQHWNGAQDQYGSSGYSQQPSSSRSGVAGTQNGTGYQR